MLAFGIIGAIALIIIIVAFIKQILKGWRAK